MKKSIKKSAHTTPRRKRPLVWKDVEHSFEAEAMYGFSEQAFTKSKVDPRLLTIPPSVYGTVEAMSFQSTARDKAELLRILKASLGTYDPGSCRCDGKRVNVVVDWSIRCALPLWLDETYPGSAKALREMRPLLWSEDMVNALSALHTMWWQIDADRVGNRYSAIERHAREIAFRRVSNVVRHLAHAVARQIDGHVLSGHIGHAGGGQDTWLCRQSVREMDCARVRPTIPALLTVLRAVHLGDSQIMVAERCVWPLPKTKKRVA